MSAIITIQSAYFNNVFLRMDGTGVDQPSPNGGGTVNCHYGAQTYEKFELIGQWDGTFAIASIEFPGVYLRVNGTSANCQFGVGPLEKFYIVPQDAGTVAIVSQNYPGRYLRMDGDGVTQSKPTGGTVNCQTYVGPYEKFRINLI